MNEEQKKKKALYDRKYMDEHYKKVYLQITPEEKERWQEAAKEEGKPLQRFVKDCVDEHIQGKN